MAGPENIEFNISLTTVQGYLGAAALALTGFVPILLLYGHPKIASGCGLVAALIGALKGPIGQLQKDAGLQEAIPVGSTKAEMVPSHATPNDPNATVVK